MTFTRRDWLLLALAAADGEDLTPVQIQKVMFLLGEKMGGSLPSRYYEFKPYNYGPFSREVYQDAEALDREGMVRVSPGVPGRRWATYAATEVGLGRARQISPKVDARALGYLRRVVTWARSLTFQELVSAIYREFPDQRANSVFVE